MEDGDYVVARDEINEEDEENNSCTKSVAVVIGLLSQVIMSIKSTAWTFLFGIQVGCSMMRGNDDIKCFRVYPDQDNFVDDSVTL